MRHDQIWLGVLVAALTTVELLASTVAAQQAIPADPTVVESAESNADSPPFRRRMDLAYTIGPDGLHDYVVRIEVDILTEGGLAHAGQTAYNYNQYFHDLEIVEAETIKADGTRIDVPADRIISHASSTGQQLVFQLDRRTKTAIFPNIEVGDRVVSVGRYRQKREFLPGGFASAIAFGSDQRTAAATLTIDAHASLPLRVASHDLSYEKQENGDRVVHTWRYTGRPHRAAEPNAVSPLDHEPRALWSTFPDWDAAGAAFYGRAAEQATPTPAIRKLADEITRDSADIRAQATVIFNWVTSNIRYVAIQLGAGGFVPNSADSVLLNRYGDCKDQVTLMRALLAAKGIESEYALINAGAQIYKPFELPMVHFDHVIVYIPALDLYADPTANLSRIDELRQQLAGRPTLRVGPAGAKATRTPPAKPGASQSVTHIADVVLAADGTAKGRATIEGRGYGAQRLRGLMREAQQIGGEAVASRDLKAQGQIGKARFTLRSPNDRDEVYRIESTYTVSEKPGSEGFRTISAGPRAYASFGGAFTDAVRNDRSIEFRCAPGQFREQLTVRLPEGHTVAPIPKSIAVVLPAGTYSATYSLDGGTLMIERFYEARIEGPTCTRAMAEAILPVVTAINDDLRRRVRVIRRPEPAASTRQ